MKDLFSRSAVFLALIVLVSVAGCDGRAPLGETRLERDLRHRRVWWMERHMLVDDIETFLMIDSPSTLTPLHVP